MGRVTGSGSDYGDGDGDGNGNGYGYGDGDGDGSGSGDGDGNGNGYGNGDGNGNGSGYGDGDGYGYGSGSGNGDGNGNGSGYGYGDGNGNGYGYGYGYGDGDGNGNGSGLDLPEIDVYAAAWPTDRRARLAELRAEGAVIAYWRSDSDGQPCNTPKNRSVEHGEQARPGLVQEVAGPLELCSEHALHATTRPLRYVGGKTWIVALLGEVEQNGDKLGALRREIIAQLSGAP